MTSSLILSSCPYPRFATCLSAPVSLASSLVAQPSSQVHGHEASLVMGRIEALDAVVMRGRVHPYEGLPEWQCCLCIRIMKLMGVRVLLLTNACGALSSERLQLADLVLVRDHVSMSDLVGHSPLVGGGPGTSAREWGPRFADIGHVYDARLRRLMQAAAADTRLSHVVKQGVYAMNAGPGYRTTSEIRFMRDVLKADVAGMSLAHEAVTASHCGLRVACLSLVSGMCVADLDDDRRVHHESVLQVVQQRIPDVQRLLRRFFQLLPASEIV